MSKVHFDYTSSRWRGDQYDLPAFAGDFVILFPKSKLTKDEAWINRSDLLTRFDEIYTAMPNEQLRGQVNAYFLRRLLEDATEKKCRAAAAATVQQFPQILDYYIKEKEETGTEAHTISSAKVRETEIQFIE